MELYHGGTEIIDTPKINVGRPNLDFGPGFYLTSIYNQAKEWSLKISDERNAKPIINKYIFDKESCLKKYNYLSFSEYDAEWLQFICDCRMGKDVFKQYDVIEGGIADDRVIDTVRLFINGFIAIEDALLRLKYFKPNNQICILNQSVILELLKFISYEVVTK